MQNLQNYLQSKIEVCPISLSLKKAQKSYFLFFSWSLFLRLFKELVYSEP